MGHLDPEGVGVPIIGGPQSNTPALDVERWGKTLCRVTLSDDLDAEEWNLAMTDKTICLYHDDCENCKLIPRHSIQMIDLVDTDEVIVKVPPYPAPPFHVLWSRCGRSVTMSHAFDAGQQVELPPEEAYAHSACPGRDHRSGLHHWRGGRTGMASSLARHQRSIHREILGGELV